MTGGSFHLAGMCPSVGSCTFCLFFCVAMIHPSRVLNLDIKAEAFF